MHPSCCCCCRGPDPSRRFVLFFFFYAITVNLQSLYMILCVCMYVCVYVCVCASPWVGCVPQAGFHIARSDYIRELWSARWHVRTQVTCSACTVAVCCYFCRCLILFIWIVLFFNGAATFRTMTTFVRSEGFKNVSPATSSRQGNEIFRVFFFPFWCCICISGHLFLLQYPYFFCFLLFVCVYMCVCVCVCVCGVVCIR